MLEIKFYGPFTLEKCYCQSFMIKYITNMENTSYILYLSKLQILLDNRSDAEQEPIQCYRNSEELGNGTSMSSRQIGTWPQLIGCALFKIWSLISDCELKNRIGYLTGRLDIQEVSTENQKITEGIPEHLERQARKTYADE